jgi:thiamine biosynthesis lipoprotein
MAAIHHFQHRAMATHFEVRLADVDAAYAAQAAQASFDRIDDLESRLSRFRPASEVRRIATLRPGEAMRLTPAVFACLETAKRMEEATGGAFSPTAVMGVHSPYPQWSLLQGELSIRCDGGRIEFDLGAIGKGFALDQVALLLREWECPSFLLVAGGSSIVAGDAPQSLDGWSCGLGDASTAHRLLLSGASLSGSGLAVQGSHIVDPRTGTPAARTARAWALCDTGAESDALSTAAMVLETPELDDVVAATPSWLVLLEQDSGIRMVGKRGAPQTGQPGPAFI